MDPKSCSVSLKNEYKKTSSPKLLQKRCLVRLQGLEPWTRGLRVRCSTNWAKGACYAFFTQNWLYINAKKKASTILKFLVLLSSLSRSFTCFFFWKDRVDHISVGFHLLPGDRNHILPEMELIGPVGLLHQIGFCLIGIEFLLVRSIEGGRLLMTSSCSGSM